MLFASVAPLHSFGRFFCFSVFAHCVALLLCFVSVFLVGHSVHGRCAAVFCVSLNEKQNVSSFLARTFIPQIMTLWVIIIYYCVVFMVSKESFRSTPVKNTNNILPVYFDDVMV